MEHQPEGSKDVDYLAFALEGSQAKPEKHQEESNGNISMTGIPGDDGETKIRDKATIESVT